MKLPWGLRWWELLPEVVVALALGLFLITETSAATSAFKSATAIKLMALVGVVWFAGRFVLVRYTRWPGMRLAVFAAAAAGVVVVVVLPAYDDTTVVESLPGAAAEPLVTRPAATTTTTFAVPPASSVIPRAPSTTTAPSAPPVRATSTTTSTTTPFVPLPPAREAPAPQPVAVRSSAIRGIDHRARGKAVVYRQPDGALVVGLEDINIQPGPDYDVYVVPGAGRERIAGGTRLDDLRGNKGTQYYPVPRGTDVTKGPWTVLVWCQTFDVPVAAATPA